MTPKSFFEKLVAGAENSVKAKAMAAAGAVGDDFGIAALSRFRSESYNKPVARDSESVELDWLKRWAMYSPRALALRCADSNRTFSYRELYERSNHLAQQLRTCFQLQKGERVAVLAQNEPETIFLFFALQRIGAILVPINFRLAPREIDHVLSDSGAKLLIWQNTFASTMAELEQKPDALLAFEGKGGLTDWIFGSEPHEFMPMESDLDAPVMILYTSGTTGKPKGALISNKMLFWNSVNTGLRLNITSSDTTLIFHPFFHTSGWNVLTTPFLHHGASIVLLKKFDPERVLAVAEEHGITVLFGVPTMMDMMARAETFAKVALKKVRYAIVGGEPMPVPLIRTWAEKGIPVRQGYGLTEFGPNVFSLNEEDSIRKIGSIGFPNFYVDVKILAASGEELEEPGQVGELCLRGPSCTPGYWRNAKATQETISEGWLHTGDLVRKDEEGYFYVVGRKKEMFISGAENIYPAELESFIRTHPQVREVAVVGVRDDRWGEVGKCFYSTENGAPIDESELRAFCQQGLARYKVPKFFVHMNELPKGTSGKIHRLSLTAQ
ncbi:MAG: long-chain fatty acid--CoA ligase [Bacteriovoracia bacterium]